MMASAAQLREPKQERSRRSFERIRKAALALLRERGAEDFTLAEVCVRAEASMGAIYGRVSGKDELIRLLHVQELDKIDAQTTRALNPGDVIGMSFEGAIEHLVNRIGSVLKANADVMRPFMLRAANDKAISERGRHSHSLMKAMYLQTLLPYSDDIGHADQVRAVEWSFTIVYSVIARRLGLGSTIEGADDNIDWETFLKELTATASAYLVLPRVGR